MSFKTTDSLSIRRHQAYSGSRGKETQNAVVTGFDARGHHFYQIMNKTVDVSFEIYRSSCALKSILWRSIMSSHKVAVLIPITWRPKSLLGSETTAEGKSTNQRGSSWSAGFARMFISLPICVMASSRRIESWIIAGKKGIRNGPDIAWSEKRACAWVCLFPIHQT